MGRHEDQIEVHVVHRWTHADTAARAAQSVVTGDIGKVSWQTDDSSLWWLSDTGPDWIQFAGGDKGDTGADSTVQGDTGDDGGVGATGVDGPQGDTGADSTVQGDTGDDGLQGATGADGPQGDTGDTGAQGDQGDTGSDGVGYSFVYEFDTGLVAPPGSGEIRFDNATISSVTTVWVHDTDRDSNDLDLNLDDFGAGDHIKIVSEVDTDFATFEITSASDDGVYHTFNVTYIGNGGGFADAENISLAPAFSGLIGDTGTSGDTGTEYPWLGQWLISVAYVVNDTVHNDGSGYICISDHTSSASDEPGVGGSWTTFWDILVEKGDTGATQGDTGDQGDTGVPAPLVYEVFRNIAVHTDTTWFSLFTDGASGQLLIASNEAWTVKVLVIGLTSGAAERWAYELNGMVVNDGGTTTVVSGTPTNISESDAAYDVQLVADDTNDAIEVQVRRSGGSDFDINWRATVISAEESY